MEKFVINGGKRLSGHVEISGAKNAILPILAASILAQDGESCLEEVPNLEDVRVMCELLKSLGVKVNHIPDQKKLFINSAALENKILPYNLVNKLRASFLLMGSLLARYGTAKIFLPGGCKIGSRPIDLHLKGFEALGCNISQVNDYIEMTTPNGLHGSQIYLDFPSVGATENILIAASMAEGQTIIENPAKEPEIVDLANYLNIMGAHIRGAGTDVIKVEGVKILNAHAYTIVPDRIESATFVLAAVITQSEIFIHNVIIDHLTPLIYKLTDAGVTISEESDGILVRCDKRLKAINIKTLPYPNFPTDMQAPMMAVLTLAEGTSKVTETVFENRFMHVAALRRMGADIKIDNNQAIIEGQKKLIGCKVKATDLRAGAAMVLAALAAEGETQISDIYHIDRGYDNLVQKLANLGADIKRVDC